MLLRTARPALPPVILPRAVLRGGRGRPPWRRAAVLGLAIASFLGASTVASTAAYLAVPAPTGDFSVGRATTLIVDAGRSDPWSGRPTRDIPLIAWYPAEAEGGSRAPYVPDYDRLRSGLVASGELDDVTVAALAAVRPTSRQGAIVSADTERHPVVLLSPGNATNVAFYAALAEDLASHGYVVIGIDHPFQVAAAVLADGSIATYRERFPGTETMEASLGARIDQRAADIAAVLERVEVDAIGVPALAGRLDPDAVVVVGHSNGGLAAIEACRRLARLVACVNIDGQAAGGAFGVEQAAVAPDQPFLFLTKERTLHPALAARFEAAGDGAYRVVLPDATHSAFADGPRFAPRILPLDGIADHVLAVERAVIAAFLDGVLEGRTAPPFDGLEPALDLYIDAYPLGGRPPLPVG
jgi:pimeloyl-ACP methyl ester carboxylesterase